MILNHEQLRARARTFALTHELRYSHFVASGFWPALRTDMSRMHAFAERLSRQRSDCIQPAEDWLLDHIAFLETQAQDVHRMLNRVTLRHLPVLRGTSLPRIYAICDDYLEHIDGHYDGASFELYIQAYQDISVLQVLECWMLPAAMRVVMMRRLAHVMQEVQRRHDVCRRIVSILGRIGARRLTDVQIRALLNREAKREPFTPIEIVHLVRHLNEWEPDIQMVRAWLAAHVENSADSLEKMVSYEHQLQADLQVTSGNLVQSLHRLERHPWRQSFSRLSHVEQILRRDKGQGAYRELDETSTDTLRNRVVTLAERMRVPETLVAETALSLSEKRRHSLCVEGAGAEAADVPPREACLPYHLLHPKGVAALKTALGQSARPRRLPHIVIRSHSLAVYLTSAALLFVALMLLAAISVVGGVPVGPLGWVAVFAALALPISQWALILLHAAIRRCCRPTMLLRYDFSAGLPDDARTMVVIPIIWSSVAEVDDIMERLLVHAMANREANIHFAVLADFTDASAQELPGDAALLQHAVNRIRELQADHGSDKFFLFHRERRYNPREKVYMGWERKRGKLVEFVELLSGNDTSFMTIVGETRLLSGIRYVFTIDHDTRLPIGVVQRLAGTIHLPYNRPRLNESRTRVVDGFGVLQPRMGVSYESTQRSRFASLWAGSPGIDPYAFTASNPYQDLMNESIFVGKGIFDVAAFRDTVVERIPDNRVLSHDILEGGFLRAGFTSDIEVVEDQPSTFYAYQLRQHRWIRGDWQLISWLAQACRDRNGDVQRNDLCGLARWQIIDNLRGSLVKPGLFAVAILGVGTLPGRTAAWAAIVGLTLLLPFWCSVTRVRAGRSGWSVIRRAGLRSIIQCMTLPFETVVAFDAIVRSLYRMGISGRRMLEWVPAARMDGSHGRLPPFVSVWAGYLVGVWFVLVAWLSGDTFSRGLAVVASILWGLALPVIRYLDQPQLRRRPKWLEGASDDLQAWAHQIWSFYAHYVTSEHCWLPPDNVQYYPAETVASRTSPTNIGLYMACVVAARDLDFISTDEMLTRLEATCDTLSRLDKWRGHLFNWYDTRTGEPLPPRYVSTVDSGNLVAYLMVVSQALLSLPEGDTNRIRKLVAVITEFVEATDFTTLYSPNERLFCLGYHVDADRRESILYDLLASEARQTSFVAIALGQVPVSHWFVLARTMTLSAGRKTLLSWSGTMFEYLMPSLIMRTYPNTIWDSTYHGVVHRQQAYAQMYGVPYGISESGYYAFDYQMNYQYRAFGVPGLGLDRGLERHLVVAPYATMMSLPVAGESGLRALQRFAALGAMGEYGFHESVDFTKDRLPTGSTYEVIRSFMAHHQGMSLLTLTNLLKDDVMIERFHAHPCVRAADLLLQELNPSKAALIEAPIGLRTTPAIFDTTDRDTLRVFTKSNARHDVCLLSNGRLTSVTTTRGDGFLMWNGIFVTRWREDSVLPSWGPALYIHNPVTDETWSPSRYPCYTASDERIEFKLHEAVCGTRYGDVEANLAVVVAPNVDAEVRRLTLANHGAQARTLEITSFLELALASQAADSAHPAFSKLFVQTSHDPEHHCILAKRRPRDTKEDPVWAAHSLYMAGDESGHETFETDRAAFIGRGYSLATPVGINGPLRGTTGSVADPAFIMRRTVDLPAHGSAEVYMVTAAAQNRETVLAIIEQMQIQAQAERAYHTAWIRTQIDLRHLRLSAAQALTAQQLAGRLLLPSVLSPLRTQAILSNTLGQSGLWSLGISGDIPIMTLCVRDMADFSFAADVARQHQYLCMLGLQLDFVLLDDTAGGYQDAMQTRLRDTLAARGIYHMNRIFVLKGSNLSEAQRILLQTVSRVWLRADGPSLTAQLREEGKLALPSAMTVQFQTPALPHRPQQSSYGEFPNGYGSFIEDGTAYQIEVQSGAYLPRPWSNVIANPYFGFLITELGTGYTWWRNAHECMVTPWRNDPVLDPPGEALYLHDLDSNEVWSATPKPAGDGRTYRVTHRFGSTSFEQTDGDVTHTLELFVPRDDPVKIMQLTLHNQSNRQKRIAVTYYAEWVIGVLREAQAPYIVSTWDEATGTLLATNRYQETFGNAVAFLHVQAAGGPGVSQSSSWTANRAEFLGVNGHMARPAALDARVLSGQLGPTHSSCGAVKTHVELAPGQECTVLVLLGCADSTQAATALVERYGNADTCARERGAVAEQWQHVTHQVQVKTPDRAMDVLLNGWLLYQALCCRIWARTAFYQAGGAFGFRDQLQDGLALLHADSSITRAQILRNAEHQYQEGDVQHWWHEETKKGIRTRISDDLLWLPYAVSRYVEHTGDISLLQERVSFLHSEPLKPDELERYEDTVPSDEQGTVLTHCLRAILHSLARMGEHGLPLIGTGDWNDGMNLVGAKGRGESVWLGWFLLDVLKRCVALNDILPAELASEARQAATQFQTAAETLLVSLNEHVWDGAWFRRAFTDTGTWLGSISARECRIDAIAQSWSVISQGTSIERQQRVMKSLNRELVDRSLGLAQLLAPAFDTAEPSPGYIQGYPPGIRENGGQYTHGVIWSIVAWAMLGERDKAHELFAMLNPIHHTRTPQEVRQFGNEPYVMTADIYTAAPHQGHGGWSWYTGAAGWMYQAGLEYVLGVRRQADRLIIDPCVPPDWNSFQVTYRFGHAVYVIDVHCEGTISERQVWMVDGHQQGFAYLELVDDGKTHQVIVHTSRVKLTTVG